MFKIGDSVICSYNYKGKIVAFPSDTMALVKVNEVVYKNKKPKQVIRKHLYDINSLTKIHGME